ncbi:MAG TPA: peptidoglycan DD-metalloendopeptidase family protein [Candidatus Dormibacteraeota bacterium]|nr:peptidoglycan DD-metalloendopeptidase family protein [Candidatus Dormibacteraeota bacterium]
MIRSLARTALLGVMAAWLLGGAATTSSATTCPTPPASGSRVTCPPPDPNQALYDQLRSRLKGDLNRALASQQQLSMALLQTAASEQSLKTQIAAEVAKIATIDAEIVKLDAGIADTQGQIDLEKAQVGALARAISRQPDSLLELIAGARNLHDALVAASDMVVAGQRAHDLQAKLEADLALLQTDRAARDADLASEIGVASQLTSNLNALNFSISRLNDLTTQLTALMGQLNSATKGVSNQPPDVTAALAQLLEQQEQLLIQRAYEAAWSQAQVGAGQAAIRGTLPPGTALPGLALSWPIAGATITQPFGPSTLILEPPLGQYLHFHTGIDIAAALGTPVTAAADGIVVAVAHTQVGYGNYVIVAHGGGIMTLYGHLLETEVRVGDPVARGQRVGLEGTSGMSTGPHLHFELRVNDEVTDPVAYLPPLNGQLTPKP